MRAGRGRLEQDVIAIVEVDQQARRFSALATLSPRYG